MKEQIKHRSYRKIRLRKSSKLDPFKKMPVIDQTVSYTYSRFARNLNKVLRSGYCTINQFELIRYESIEPFYLYAEKLKNGSVISHYPHLSKRDITSVIRLIGGYFKESNDTLEDVNKNGRTIPPRSNLSQEINTLSGLIDTSYEQLMKNMERSRKIKRTGSDAIAYELKLQQLKKFVAELATVIDFHFILLNTLESDTGIMLGIEESRMISWMFVQLNKIRPSKSLAYINPFAPVEERIAFTVAFPRIDENLCFEDRVKELCRYLDDCKRSTERVIPNTEQEAVLRYIDWASEEMDPQSEYRRSNQTTMDEFIDTKRTFLTACILLANRETEEFIQTLSTMSNELVNAIPKTRLAESSVGDNSGGN